MDHGRLALDREVRQLRPDERLAGLASDRGLDVDLPRGRGRHQPRREVHRVAETHERAAHRVAVGAAARPPMGDADLDVARRGRLVEVAQLEDGRRRPGRVVLVGDRRAEHAVQVGALVTERQLQDVAAEAGHDPLRRPDEGVELLDGVLVLVVVDAAEAQEDRIRGPQLGEELAPAGAQPLVDSGQQPRTDEGLVEVRRLLDVDRRDIDQEVLDDAEGPTGRRIVPAFTDRHPVAETRRRRWVQHDLALLGVVLRLGEVVDQAPGQDIDELDGGIADDEAPGRPDRDRDLERQPDDRARPGSRPCPRAPSPPASPIAAAVARVPSSPSIQQVIASPEK